MLDRSVAPAFVEPKKFYLPDPEIVHFNNGSRFLFLNVGDQPIIKIEFIFKAGSWFESIPGVAFFTGKMLTEGTASFNSKDIAEALDQYGTFLEVHPGFDYTNLSVYIPTRHFEKIESILNEILFTPTFPDHECELMKKIQIQQLSIKEKKNDFVAYRLFRSNLYGDSPYGHVMSEESINRISRKDLLHHFTQWVEGKFDVFLTGKFDSAFQQRIIRFFENKLRETHKFEGKEFQSISHFENRIEKEESLQSSILMGKRSINRDHEKYAGLLLLNEVFGGYFGSRLMQNIREDKGYTYSIYSHMVTMRNDAYFVINTDVKKANKNQAVEEINSEIDTLKTELIGEEELFQVKNYLKGSMLNTLTTPFALTEKLKNIYFYDLGNDFYEKVFDKIDNTNNEELLELANSVLFNQPLSSVIVG